MRYEQRSELCTRGLVKKKKKEFVECVQARAASRAFRHAIYIYTSLPMYIPFTYIGNKKKPSDYHHHAPRHYLETRTAAKRPSRLHTFAELRCIVTLPKEAWHAKDELRQKKKKIIYM